MKLRSHTYRFLIASFLLLNSIATMAQFVIPDPNFRQFLKTNYPTVINADQTLNNVVASTITGPFVCRNQNLSSLSGIEYFTSITTLEVKQNPNLHSIPNIDGLTGITILGLDSNGLTSLPNLSTLVNLQILSFRNNQISTVPSLNGLSLINVFFFDYNNITTLPSLSSLVNLQQFICSYNPLTSLPSFSTLVKLNIFICRYTPLTTLPDFSNCTQLQYFKCTNTPITSLPNLNNCPLLQMELYNDQLTSIPNLTIFPSLTEMNASNNFLSFEDIVPSLSQPAFSSFVFSPQTPGVANTVNAVQLSTTTLNLNFDNSVTGNVYNWHKNGTLYATTSVNNLIFNSVQPTDEGVYTCTITNTTPALVGITLNAQPITLKVSACIVANDIRFTLLNTSCTYPIKVLIDESSFTAGTSPFSYTVQNSQNTYSFNSPNFSLSAEGTYDLIVKDALGCQVTFPSKLVIPRNEQCDPVFYPNGDGIAETYYIENSGYARIYDRNGQLVKEFNVPASWDGTDSKGATSPSGLYVIVVNESTNIRVTLLR